MCGWENNEDYYPSRSESYDCPYDNRTDTPTSGSNCPYDNRTDTPANGSNCPCDNRADTPASRPNASASNCDDRDECINNGSTSLPNNSCDEREDNANVPPEGGGTGTTIGNGTTTPIAPTKSRFLFSLCMKFRTCACVKPNFFLISFRFSPLFRSSHISFEY